MKKLLCVLAVVMACVSSCAWAVEYGAAGYETEGYNEAHAWEISSAATLAKVRDDVNNNNSVIKSGYHFKITQDIDLTAMNWIPINITANQALTFDGDNHTLTVAINREINGNSLDGAYSGVFGNVERGTIKNLSVTGSIRLTGTSRAYFLSACAGGIAGNIERGTIENCTFNGNIYGNNEGASIKAGGIVGQAGGLEGNTGFTIRNCKVGNISPVEISLTVGWSTTPSYAGGIVGHFWDMNNGNSITGNYSRATLEADHSGAIYGAREGTNGTVSGNTEANPNSNPDPDPDPDPNPKDELTITKASLANGTVGVYYSDRLTANVSGVTWSASGLPSWLSLDASSGTLSGNPATAETYRFTVKATRGELSAEKEYTITIAEKASGDGGDTGGSGGGGGGGGCDSGLGALGLMFAALILKRSR